MAKSKCEICDRIFKNEESLEMHNRAKHSAPESKKEKSSNKNTGKIIGFSIVAGIILLMVWLIFSVVTAGSENKEFAKCITDNGAIMYGAYWCSACKEQKDIFGKSFKEINYVECSLPNKGGQNEICNTAGIQSYPTWEFQDGSRITGVQYLQQLGLSTGCTLP